MGDHAGERRLALVRVEAEAAMADAALAFDIGHLGDHQAGAGIGQHAEMGEVPVGSDAVGGAVLAHRGGHDPVRKLEAGEPDRRKQDAHGIAVGGWKRETEEGESVCPVHLRDPAGNLTSMQAIPLHPPSPMASRTFRSRPPAPKGRPARWGNRAGHWDRRGGSGGGERRSGL